MDPSQPPAPGVVTTEVRGVVLVWVSVGGGGGMCLGAVAGHENPILALNPRSAMAAAHIGGCQKLKLQQ